MWEQGNSPHGFDDLYQEYVNRAAGMDGGGGGGGGGAKREGGGPGGLIMASIAAGERQLMPMPPELTSRMWADQQENARQANNPNNWTHLDGTRVQKEEYATGIYRKGKDLVSDGPNRGSHVNGTPTSEVFRKGYEGGGVRAGGTHIHVTGNGRHLLWDRDQAIRYRFISGTGHISAPTKLEIFRPYTSGEGGQYYHTNDGIHVIPGRLPW
jgi:hypothetical protein